MHRVIEQKAWKYRQKKGSTFTCVIKLVFDSPVLSITIFIIAHNFSLPIC